MPALTWSLIQEHAGHPAGLVPLLLATPEQERLAFGPELTARVRAMRAGDWWETPSPGPVIGLAAIACLPTAAKAGAVLGRPDLLESPGVPAGEFLRIAGARRLTWLGDLGLRLAGRIRPTGPGLAEWRLVSALVLQGGAAPPATAGFVRGWLRELHEHDGNTPPAVLDRLREHPWRAALLPAVFALDGLGGELFWQWWDGSEWTRSPAFGTAVARLAEEGALDREEIVAATVDRLARPDRPASLRPFLLLHDELAPTVDEMTRHAADYAHMLGVASSTVAGLAQRALQAVDDAGRLDPAVLAEASAGLLARKEKGLARAQLSWLERVAAREPGRAGALAGAMAVAFGHPSLDVQDQALAAIGRLAPRLGPGDRAAILGAAGSLAGALHARAIALVSPETPASGAATSSGATIAGTPRAAPMPPPIASAAELAEEFGTLLHEETAVRWERVLAALITLGPGAAEALAPVLARHADRLAGYGWTRVRFLGEATRAILDGAEGPMAGRVRWEAVYAGDDASLIHTPGDVLKLRIAEIAQRWCAAPVTTLLATPTGSDGSLDAEVLAARLARAEAEGREPWPLDYEQALLRVVIDPAARPAAERLTSARGRQFATWLADGGLPVPISTRFEQEGGAVKRVVANLDPARADDRGLILETPITTLSRSPRPGWESDYELSGEILAMVLPHHREVAAAWALPGLAALADQDSRDASLVPLLAEASGPIGPAMSLAVVYTLAARHEPDRIAAVDAFLTLAARPEPFAATVGAELGALGRDDVIKLSRVASALADAHRAGAAAAVWEVLATALPILLPAAPRGLPDLLEVATQAAAAIGAQAAIPELTAVAARKGSSRLVREARRLAEVLT
ncbi:hypothetical protein Acy02nite_07230 [Actinoplanes cyaneus]|uniref:Secreted protein n=1 Tax=Actinoplanes cyaneus TaxID=52696 RepID=A0A919M1W4_9ACTN|nr:DUF6493 family protein [Actinoplanes cyaneus]MCW2135795.1 hypothetical protein [Actinoplanes cyaneus]GID62842.1 hypothetical protein Acy02nite_07230 [Actinoplanes cyaneus]